jgi:hypothetical protein
MKDIVTRTTSKLKPNFEHGSTFIYIATQTVADGTDHIDPASYAD